MNLVPWHPAKVATLWVDAGTGEARDDDGGRLRIGDGGPVTLRDVLDLADYTRAPRVMLTGRNPGPAWLLGELPPASDPHGRPVEWEHGAHHLDHATPTGRYRHGAARVEVRRAAEWFGEGDYTPAQARGAWNVLAATVAGMAPGAGLLGAPGATGRELWLHACKRDENGRTVAPAQVAPEVAELLRATSGQHRIQLLPAAADTMPALWVMDGRLMYAAMVHELGTGPGRILTADELGALLDSARGRYARGWFHVRATVPDWWEHVGILPRQREGEGAGWEYPAEPGRTFDTWADSAEVHLAAAQFGWKVEPLAGSVLWEKGRPLDTWQERIVRAYGAADWPTASAPTEGDQRRVRMVRAGLRAMLLYAVGGWHSSGRTETTVTPGAMTRPAGEGWGAPEVTATGAVWRRTVPLDGRAALMAHPEWSTQIWGRARARVLWAPTAVKGKPGGALCTAPGELVSIYGDAVMTTTRPDWAHDEHDDGRVGRLRVKGHACGPLPWPANGPERDALMHRAEARKPQPCTCA